MAEEVKIIITGDDKASKNIKKVSKETKTLSKNLKDATIPLAAVSGALIYLSNNMVNAAANAEEIGSKFNVVFSDIKDEAQKWAKETGDSIGRATSTMQEFSSGLGDVLKPLGFTTKEAFKMSTAMSELAFDVASFNNKQDADVINSFKAALTGERESLKSLGIVMSELDVKQEAYNLGLAEEGETLSKTAKAQATMSLLYKNTADAQGDLLRTQDSYTNQTKRLNENLKEMYENIGKQLMPIFAKFKEIINQLIETFQGLSPEWQNTIIMAAAAIAAFTGILAVMGTVIALAPILGTAFSVMLGPIGLVTAAIIALGIAWNNNFLGIRDITIDIFDNYIKPKFDDFMKFINETFLPNFNKFVEDIEITFTPIITFFQENWDAIKSIFNIALDSIKFINSVFWESLVLVAKTGFEMLMLPINVGLDLLKGDWDGAWNHIKDSFISIFEGIRDFALNILNDITGFFTDTFNNIKSTLKSISDYVGITTAEVAAIPTNYQAQGNIMMPTRASGYADGGIINKPTMALMGEAGMSEAVVPLPNGRSIPVDINGGGTTININNPTVRNDNDIKEIANQVGQVLARQLDLSRNRLAT